MNRSGLIALQIVGALTILPYPAVLVANVMSIAAPGQTRSGAIPFLLLSAYPLVWVGLYIFSWRAMSHGAAGLAFGLSSVPALAGVCAAGIWAFSWVGFVARSKTGDGLVRRQIEPRNPLLSTLWLTGGEKRFPSTRPSVPVEEALRSIDENAARVNIAVEPYGTPLRVAVDNLMFNLDGSPIRDARRQEDLIRIVRSLVSHGAHFAADEKTDLHRQWLLRRAMHGGPITTSSENPLVWRILTRRRDGVTPFLLRPEEAALLNTSTGLHGTPLYSALLQDAPDAYSELIRAGARLSEAEQLDDAAEAALARVLANNPDLQRTYAGAR